MIEDGVSGYLFETDEEAIERADELLGSNEKRHEMGERARAHAAERSWRSATLLLIEYYEEGAEHVEVRRAVWTNRRFLGFGEPECAARYVA